MCENSKPNRAKYFRNLSASFDKDLRVRARKCLPDVVIGRSALLRSGGFEQRRARLHGNAVLGGADLHFEVNGESVLNVNDDVRLDQLPEAVFFN